MKAVLTVLTLAMLEAPCVSALGASATPTPTPIPRQLDQRQRDWDPVKDLYFRNAPLTFSPTMSPTPRISKTAVARPTPTPTQAPRVR